MTTFEREIRRLALKESVEYHVPLIVGALLLVGIILGVMYWGVTTSEYYVPGPLQPGQERPTYHG